MGESESFVDALGDVAAYAGAVYVGLAFIAIVVTARDEATWLQRLAPLAGVTALFFGVVLPWDRPGCGAAPLSGC
jgi:NADH:ubiquinone oxidoreductase subunit 6 (subunit J)